MKKYFRLFLVLAILLIIVAFLWSYFGTGGSGVSMLPGQGTGSSDSSAAKRQEQKALQEPKPPVEPLDSSSSAPTDESSESSISEVRVVKKSGQIEVLINGKADKNWKQTLKQAHAKNPATFYLGASGNVNYNELQAVKDYLISQGIDFVD